MRPLLYLIKDLQESESRALFNYHGKEILSNDFVNEVISLAKQLSSTSLHSFALCYQDSYQFTVALFALLHCNKQPILLPNNQPGTINHFANEYDAILSEDKPISFSSAHKRGVIRKVLDENQSILLFTSGSSGHPKKILCVLRQLISECEMLEKTFGDQLQNSSVFSTVSHQHLYGLLFTVLWPLSANRIIALPELHYPENIEKIIQSHDKLILVSSPALLSRMPTYKINKNYLTVFSSGSLLNKAAAINIHQALGIYPIEILGCTETGGVGFRQQLIHEQWTPFDKVKIALDHVTQCLKIQSPFCHDTRAIMMGDKATINQDGTFQLLGRADRIVKIEDKRVSLTEIENRLTENEWVNKAYALPIQSNRQFIGVVLELTPKGKSVLNRQGKQFIKSALKKNLSEHFDLILIPKQFRFVKTMPTNQQGKLTLFEVRKLFNVAPQLINQKKYPLMIDCKQVDDHHLIFDLKVQQEILFFQGHFPDSPILPGVVQVDWVISFANEFFNLAKEKLTQIAQVKFTKVIKPESHLQLSIKLDKDQLTFKYYHHDTLYSSGKIKVTS